MKKLFNKYEIAKPKRSKKRVFVVIGLLVLVVIASGVIVLLQKKQTKAPAPDTAGSETVTFSTDNPDESKQKANSYNWKGGSNDPKKIRIQTIGVDSYIQRMGVDQHKKIAVPNNIHLAGWFVDSQQPGQNGLSIIAGHVTGKKGDGVFKNLGQLKKDDTFEIEVGSGEVKKYKVAEVKQVKEVESTDILFSQKSEIKSQLNLITCGGKFDSSTNQYEDRVIVVAELQ